MPLPQKKDPLAFTKKMTQMFAAKHAPKKEEEEEEPKEAKKPRQLRSNKIDAELLMTENERRLEEMKNKRVDGPLDQSKTWDNYGVPPADDKDAFIDPDRPPVTLRQEKRIKNLVTKETHEIIKNKRGWAYYEKH